MYKVILALACLTRPGLGRRVQSSSPQLQSIPSADIQTPSPRLQADEPMGVTSTVNPLEVFTMVLLATNPGVAFAPLGMKAFHSVSSARRCQDALELGHRPNRASTIGMSESGSSKALVFNSLGTALQRVGTDSRSGWSEYAGSWVKMPSSKPWAVVHFVGGAGFGAAPQLCYDVLLSGIVKELGVMVIATPYGLDTDHWKLSKAVHQQFEDAMDATRSISGIVSSFDVPVYRIGHSLGAKLHVLKSLLDADEGVPSVLCDPSALLAFNNFGLADSAALAADFIGRIQGFDRGAEVARNVFSAFNVMQTMAAASGIQNSFDVSPAPQELEEAVRQKYNAPFTALYRFGGDNLDCSKRLLDVAPPEARISFNELQGGHLSPVVFRLETADLDPTLAMLLGNTQGFTFGSPEAVEPLTESLCSWMRQAVPNRLGS